MASGNDFDSVAGNLFANFNKPLTTLREKGMQHPDEHAPFTLSQSGPQNAHLGTSAKGPFAEDT